MITITSAVENALAQDSRTFLVKLWDGSTEIGGSVRALKVNKGSCGAEKFELGAVYSPYITATIDYDGATMDNLNGKELLVQIGVNVGTLDNPDYSYIDIGYFTVIKPQVQGTLVYITAYGRLSLLTDMYPTDSQQTLTQVLSTITTTTGMAVTVKGDLDLTGTVSGLSGWTILETLQIVAGLVGGYVTEDNAGGIVLASFDAYSETDTTRNPATIYVSNDNDFKALPTLLDAETVLDGITCYKSLAVGDAGADKFVYGTGLYEYANEYMTQTMFDNMTAKIGGWSHRAGVLNMAHGTPILEPWDAVQIIAGGVTFVIPCMSIEIVFDGGIACNVVSVGKTVADEETHFQGALSQRVARTLEVAQEAQSTAEEAKGIADNTAQYFWYTGTGTDTGAHITEIPSTEFIQNPSGSNLLARSNGIAVRDGLTELASFGATGSRVGLANEGNVVMDADSIDIKQGNTILSTFGVDGVQIGKEDENRLLITNTDMTQVSADGIVYFKTDTDGTSRTIDINKDFGAFYKTISSGTTWSGAQILSNQQGYLSDYPDGAEVTFSLADIAKWRFNNPASATGSLQQVSMDGFSRMAVSGGNTMEFTLSPITITIGENFSKTCYARFKFVDDNITFTLQCIVSVTPRKEYTVRWQVLPSASYTFTSASMGRIDVPKSGFKYSYDLSTPSYQLGTTPYDVAPFSAIIGESLIATQEDQVAVGKYNEEDADDNYGFMVGIGSTDADRKTAFAVTRDGDNETYVNTTATSGIDSNISSRLNLLGWISDVISNKHLSFKQTLYKVLDWIYQNKVYVTETGTSNGWEYRKYSDGHIDAWYYGSKSLANYTTVNGFYGYGYNAINLPFTMADTHYQCDIDFLIGNGFSFGASVRKSTTQLTNLFALSTANGTQTVYLNAHIYGKLA